MQVSTTITYTAEEDGFDHKITITQELYESYAIDYLHHFRDVLLVEGIGVEGLAAEMPSGEVIWDS